MKISKQKLRSVIREEIQSLLSEANKYVNDRTYKKFKFETNRAISQAKEALATADLYKSALAIVDNYEEDLALGVKSTLDDMFSKDVDVEIIVVKYGKWDIGISVDTSIDDFGSDVSTVMKSLNSSLSNVLNKINRDKKINIDVRLEEDRLINGNVMFKLDFKNKPSTF